MELKQRLKSMSDKQIYNGEFITKWIMRIVISLCGVMMYREYAQFTTDVHDIKTTVRGLENRMIRIEYELKLKEHE